MEGVMDFDYIYSYTNDDALRDGVFVLLNDLHQAELVMALHGMTGQRVMLTQGVAEHMSSPEDMHGVLGAYRRALWDDDMKVFEFKGTEFWAFEEEDCIKMILPEER
jgi:hypothetical protein